MHERIKLVSDTVVEVQRNTDPPSKTRYEIVAGELQTCPPKTCVWDKEGNAADILVRQCFATTDSFAALADTSAVPFPGKRMKVKGWSQEFVVTAIYDDQKCDQSCKCIGEVEVWEQIAKPQRGSKLCVERDNLLPLVTPTPPAPKWRPYTAKEIAARYDDVLVFERMHQWKIIVVGPGYVIVECVNAPPRPSNRQFSLRDLLDGGTWRDTGEPCGVKEGEG